MQQWPNIIQAVGDLLTAAAAFTNLITTVVSSRNHPGGTPPATKS